MFQYEKNGQSNVPHTLNLSCILNNPDYTCKFIEHLNQQHMNINLTFEMESNGILPFLDCIISKQKNKLSTSIYWKQTLTSQGTRFYSNTIRRFRKKAIKTLVHRGYPLFRCLFSHDQEIYFLRNFFTSNGNLALTSTLYARNSWTKFNLSSTHRDPCNRINNAILFFDSLL